MFRARRAIHAILVLGIAIVLSGCYAWQYDPAPVPEVLAKQPSRVLIPIGADSFVVLLGAKVADDSVVGLIEGSAEGGERLHRFAAPLDSVPRVALEKLKVIRGARQAGDAAGKAIVPVGGYLSQLMLLGGIVFGTIAFGAYIQGAGH